ncbi:protein DpdG [Actinosynnema pretiosum]|uniref:Uncharacterized protein n=1 Tax=Actinosynnema pretiosum TaxID=42197 RepID=A0A290Z131_9PSEU|nr:protein DpdG [Actinosynnema pretiosum]ATE52695.1 hypothetical protein CNX65_04850 [Actinosynnema pretiosum]
MSLLNVNDPLPGEVIVVMRLLLSTQSPMPLERIKALLAPPSVTDRDRVTPTLNNLAELKALTRDENGMVRLTERLEADLPAIQRRIRGAALAADQAVEIGTDQSQTGSRDLIRALAWFLSLTPTKKPMTWKEAQLSQDGVLNTELGNPIVNDTRWNKFTFWAPFTGFATPGLIGQEANETSKDLVPDCTVAIRQTVADLWKPGDELDAVDFIGRLRETLPVLPGGEYSTAVGIPSPGISTAGPSVSFALLRGNDEGWLRLQRNADARQFLNVHDPDQPLHPRPFSTVIIQEAVDA